MPGKKPFSERSLTSSRERTGKKAGRPRHRATPQYTGAVRTKPTTGRIDYDENRQKIVTVD